VYLYYFATVILRMTEKEFWHCTLRKLKALNDMHKKANGQEDEGLDYVDGVF
jgi:hypothetical protein